MLDPGGPLELTRRMGYLGSKTFLLLEVCQPYFGTPRGNSGTVVLKFWCISNPTGKLRTNPKARAP